MAYCELSRNATKPTAATIVAPTSEPRSGERIAVKPRRPTTGPSSRQPGHEATATITGSAMRKMLPQT
jgi:hypothetical protein